MPTLSRRTVATLAASIGLLAALGFAIADNVAADDANIVKALRAGGFVIVVRHGATFPDQADTDPLNFDNIAAQRNLNDKGKALAKAFGDAIRQAGVSVGKVYTSKYNRAYETAVIAGFKDIEKTADITEGGLVVSPNENNRRVDAFHKLLSTAPTPGINTILITHKPNIVDALGKDWFDVKEGEATIFRPENGSYKLIARVQMGELASHGCGCEVRLRKQHRHRTKRPASRPNSIARPCQSDARVGARLRIFHVRKSG